MLIPGLRGGEPKFTESVPRSPPSLQHRPTEGPRTGQVPKLTIRIQRMTTTSSQYTVSHSQALHQSSLRSRPLHDPTTHTKRPQELEMTLRSSSQTPAGWFLQGQFFSSPTSGPQAPGYNPPAQP